ncbi:MAG: 50S ribosomal protein L1, partial [Hyphomicrobium sp.]
HAGVGKASFSDEQLGQNISAFLDAILRAKPSGIKGAYLKRMAISSTMGPGVRIDVSTLPTSPVVAE